RSAGNARLPSLVPRPLRSPLRISRMKRRYPGAFLALLLLASSANYGGASETAAPGARGLPGPAVLPRVVEFSALPRKVAPFSGVVREHREGINPAADSILAFLKKNPRPLGPAELGGITLDSNGGGAQPLAPVVNNGFEGISQGPYIPSEPTVAAGPLNVFTAG